MVNGRPSYSNGRNRIFYFEDPIHHLFAWTVANVGYTHLFISSIDQFVCQTFSVFPT
jgi:hypothetical protein